MTRDQLDGRLNLTASTFNHTTGSVYQQSWSQGLTATQNSPFSSLVVAVTITMDLVVYAKSSSSFQSHRMGHKALMAVVCLSRARP